MQSNHSKRNCASWGVFAALWAVLVAAAGGGASAAPVETVLYRFKGGSDGDRPYGGLIADKEGALYGTTVSGGSCPQNQYGCGTVFKITPPAQGQTTTWTETVLYRFAGGNDGANPTWINSLILDKEGALYGTTQFGGNGSGNGNGAIYKLTPPAQGQTAWTENVLYRFCSLPNCSDGSVPFAGLILDKEGALYGTTIQYGPATANCVTYVGQIYGCGLVFKLTPPAQGQPTWTETVLYRFKGGSDGFNPYAGLIIDKEGALYSTTVSGGRSGNGGNGWGTIFKLTPPPKSDTAWTEDVLYRFKGGSDGAAPSAGLITDDRHGALYGTTGSGGSCSNQDGCGTVFKITPAAQGQPTWTETVLYRFKGGSDGANPYAGLILDKEGALYGTTVNGGSSGNGGNGWGTVFKLTRPPKSDTAWTEDVLYRFTGGSDGAIPSAGLITYDRHGALYGTTESGASDAGTVFKLTGTGFVAGIPFAAFGAKLAIDFGISPNPDAFELLSEFTLGQSSNGINPVAEPVTFQIGTFATTIPAGSFTGTGFGPFTFNGMIGGVGLGVRIEPIGTKRYALKAEALRPNLTGTKNPVPVTLTIGGDSGTVSVKADIY